MLQIKEYKRATSLDEAYEWNQKKSSVILGGMHWLKMQTKNVGMAIDLSDLGLDEIQETEEAFEIGSMVTLRQLELHEGLNQYSNHGVQKAVKDIVGVQFRNTATIGGSIFGRYGFSDLLTVFLAMDTTVVCHKAGEIALQDYAQMKADRDIIVKLIVKKTPIHMAYMAQRHARTDFPMLTCAVSYRGGMWRAAIGARPAKAEVVEDQEHLLSNVSVTESGAEEFGKKVADALVYGTNMRGSAEYRKEITPVLVKRAMLEAGKED